MQFVNRASFLTAVYSNYFASAERNMNCASGNVSPWAYLLLRKTGNLIILCKFCIVFVELSFDYITSNKDLHKLCEAYNWCYEMLKLSGGLPFWGQSKSHKLHGGIWKQLRTTSSPQGFLDCFHQG